MGTTANRWVVLPHCGARMVLVFSRSVVPILVVSKYLR